jgi:cobalamin-dependent methionine synthase I
MRTVVQAFKEAGLHDVKICVGGAPISAQYAREIGADGYAADAASAVALFKRLLGVAEEEALGAANAAAAAAATQEIAAADSSVLLSAPEPK